MNRSFAMSGSGAAPPPRREAAHVRAALKSSHVQPYDGRSVQTSAAATPMASARESAASTCMLGSTETVAPSWSPGLERLRSTSTTGVSRRHPSALPRWYDDSAAGYARRRAHGPSSRASGSFFIRATSRCFSSTRSASNPGGVYAAEAADTPSSRGHAILGGFT
ncbi:hypothetical protein AB1Y20_005009 [Prymnesium parvum]|uniref:Uncharacterized protein n=1 Tax=Prymnesium parvum TaxID=97485 RepID=A0AB34J436_PRYPA